MFKLMFGVALAAAMGLTVYLMPNPTQAQTNCTYVGNQMMCNGGGRSVTCTRVGNQVMCN